jgi:hypothetical protein
VSPVKYELGFYIPEDDIRHSHRRENLNSNRARFVRTVFPKENGLEVMRSLDLLSGGAWFKACHLLHGVVGISTA